VGGTGVLEDAFWAEGTGGVTREGVEVVHMQGEISQLSNGDGAGTKDQKMRTHVMLPLAMLL
jgi:hypothetical protein